MNTRIRSMVVMAAAASMAARAVGMVDSPKAPPGGRSYKSNGKREIERRLRQIAKRNALSSAIK